MERQIPICRTAILNGSLECGFHIVEYQCEYNHRLEPDDDFIGDGGDGMFVFKKQM